MTIIATDKQINFILSLANDRSIEESHPVFVGCIKDIKMGYADSINRKYASRMIEMLLELPKTVRIDKDSDVPAGRYAIEFGEKMRFFHVNRPDSGRWKDYVFVIEQAGSELFSIRSTTRRNEILRLIANDSDSLARYGQELGSCGMCGCKLTDETSRSIGIGPVCRSK